MLAAPTGKAAKRMAESSGMPGARTIHSALGLRSDSSDAEYEIAEGLVIIDEMAYIQLSYLGIPAVVIHGDSLLVKEYSRFYTPIYMLGGWLWKEPMSFTDQVCDDDKKLMDMLIGRKGEDE